MKSSVFIKTFLMLLFSFTLVFLFSMFFSYRRFEPMYIEENITAVKDAILDEANDIFSGTSLEDSTLMDLSSETSFIRLDSFIITEEIGPTFLSEEDIILFVIDIYDNEDIIQEGKLSYYTTKIDDINQINYIYEFEYGNYLIISTRIQSLQNIDRVLNNINTTQSITIFITIIFISFILSRSITKPIKKINEYAKNVSNLQFDTELNMKRRDEFRELITSLNEMTFNLKKSYQDLQDMNSKLSNDIEFEKRQEEKKKQLIYMINHELKTPISVIKGMVEGMIDGVGRFKERDKYLNEVRHEVTKVENLTSDLTYSLSIEDKASPLDTVDTRILKEKLTSLDEFASLHKKKISKQIKQATLAISEELLLICLTNFIKNAVLYSTGNEVSLTTESLGDNYIFTIRNKGHINEEDLANVFDIFYRSSTNKDKEGTGLGLSIVRQICEIYDYDYKLFNDNEFVVAKLSIKEKK